MSVCSRDGRLLGTVAHWREYSSNVPYVQWKAWHSFQIVGPTVDMFGRLRLWRDTCNYDEISRTEKEDIFKISSSNCKMAWDVFLTRPIFYQTVYVLPHLPPPPAPPPPPQLNRAVRIPSYVPPPPPPPHNLIELLGFHRMFQQVIC